MPRIGTGRAVWVCLLAVGVNLACIVGLVLLLAALVGGFGRGPGAIGLALPPSLPLSLALG